MRIRRHHEKGVTLIEIVISMMVVSLALLGTLFYFQQLSMQSASSITNHQALQAGYALLEEIQSMPWTFCEASDPAAYTANAPADCNQVQGLTPVAGKSRGSLTNPFNNVGDYGNYTENGLVDMNGVPIAGLNNYQLKVLLSNVSMGSIPSTEGLKIEIIIKGPSDTLTVKGYKIRHAPNALP